MTNTLKPLQQKEETLYVVANSDAEEHAARRFPHKKRKRVNGVRPTSIAGFIDRMDIAFQAGQSTGLNAVYHFIFTGAETASATVTIKNERLHVARGLSGRADCEITADAATWLGFLRKERNLVWAILRRKVRVKGKLSLLKAFGKCFPS
jgi:alkyl sulfatase BDS1-like metallo-beta-lactamase superfamily hydrolase